MTSRTDQENMALENEGLHHFRITAHVAWAGWWTEESD